MSTTPTTRIKRKRRHARVRARIGGTNTSPRLVVFRSNSAIYAQIIDDEVRKTLLAFSERNLPLEDKKGTKSERAFRVGELLAAAAAKKKIMSVRFDRGGYRYHGRVKALAEGARKGGIDF